MDAVSSQCSLSGTLLLIRITCYSIILYLWNTQISMLLTAIKTYQLAGSCERPKKKIKDVLHIVQHYNALSCEKNKILLLTVGELISVIFLDIFARLAFIDVTQVDGARLLDHGYIMASNQFRVQLIASLGVSST